MNPQWDIVACPQADCAMPAEAHPLFATPNPAGEGIILHMRLLCLNGHVTFSEQAGPSGHEEEPPAIRG